MQKPSDQLVLSAVLALGIGTAVLAQSGLRLTMGGKTVSTGVRMIDGTPYVRVADVARALNMTVAKRPGGYDLARAGAPAEAEPPGGANQVEGRHGKIGQMLFTGKWRFQVVSVDRTQKYDTRYALAHAAYEPKGERDELVVITCLLKNGQKAQVSPLLTPDFPRHTALADDQGQSYPPIAYDRRGSDNPNAGAKLLPGAQTNFAVVFSVPRDTKLKDLVFSLQAFPDDWPNGGEDVRISLAQ